MGTLPDHSQNPSSVSRDNVKERSIKIDLSPAEKKRNTVEGVYTTVYAIDLAEHDLFDQNLGLSSTSYFNISIIKSRNIL
jgi:hypothetical protein